jgi:hypothetical protein
MLFAFLTAPLCLQLDFRDSHDRFELSGEVEFVDSDDGRYRVHFTREGDDAVWGDEEVPDFVHRVFDGLELAETATVAHGYNLPKLDDGGGGSEAIDVYLTYNGANGTAHREQAADETGRTSCYLSIWPELQELGEGVVESVTIHELHHCTQYTYGNELGLTSWMLEAGATFEQYRTFTNEALDYAVGLLWFQRLNESYRAISDRDGRFEYAGMVFAKFWTEYQGEDRARWPALYEEAANHSHWEPLLEAAADNMFGSSFRNLYLDFATWNLFACDRADGNHYLDDVVACETTASVPIETAATRFDLAHSTAPFTALYQQLVVDDPDKLLHVNCDGPGTKARSRVRLVARNQDGASLIQATGVATGDDRLSVSMVPGSTDVVAVFVSTGDNPAEHSECTVTETVVDIKVVEKTACGCSGTGHTPWGFLLLPVLLIRRRHEVRRGVTSRR